MPSLPLTTERHTLHDTTQKSATDFLVEAFDLVSEHAAQEAAILFFGSCQENNVTTEFLRAAKGRIQIGVDVQGRNEKTLDVVFATFLVIDEIPDWPYPDERHVGGHDRDSNHGAKEALEVRAERI